MTRPYVTLRDVYIQNSFARISHSPKGFIYQHLVDHFSLQFHLQKPIIYVYKKLITKFRVSAHNLNIEVGRHRNIQRRNRLCQLCELNEVEDEFHFILQCPFYVEIRRKYIKKYYYIRASVFKLIQLLSVQNVKELRNLGRYLYHAENLRKEHV